MFINIQPVHNVSYKAGQLFFTGYDDKLLHKGITWFTYKGDYKKVPNIEQFSHVGICVGENKGIEATHKGIAYCDLEQYFDDPKCRIVFREPVKFDILGAKPLIDVAESYIGKKYDFKLFLGFALANCWLSRKLLPERAKLEILRLFDSKDRVLCSEFTMACLVKGGYTDRKYLRVTPRQLFFHSCLKKLKENLPEKYKIIKT